MASTGARPTSCGTSPAGYRRRLEPMPATQSSMAETPGLWRLRGHRFISALGAAEIPHVSCEVSEDRMIRKDKVLRNVAVGNDQSIHADRLERPLRPGTSGDPANEHDVPVRRVLDGLGAEVGNEVEQIDDALGILLRPADRTRGLRPISGAST
jgi:hypothetical protein